GGDCCKNGRGHERRTNADGEGGATVHLTTSLVRLAARMVSTEYTDGTGAGCGGGVARGIPLTTRVTGAGSGAPMSAAMRVPLVSVGSMSSGLRSVSMMLPSAEANAMRSASSGVTSSVTTV